ncbi:unnamed protein product [Amoebophrya sp. A25]|nr:unnamed protein product [Amoebophrya sp. A25]|eukprot:GSA25T00020779001.1
MELSVSHIAGRTTGLEVASSATSSGSISRSTNSNNAIAIPHWRSYLDSQVDAQAEHLTAQKAFWRMMVTHRALAAAGPLNATGRNAAMPRVIGGRNSVEGSLDAAGQEREEAFSALDSFEAASPRSVVDTARSTIANLIKTVDALQAEKHHMQELHFETEERARVLEHDLHEHLEKNYAMSEDLSQKKRALDNLTKRAHALTKENNSLREKLESSSKLLGASSVGTGKELIEARTKEVRDLANIEKAWKSELSSTNKALATTSPSAKTEDKDASKNLVDHVSPSKNVNETNAPAAVLGTSTAGTKTTASAEDYTLRERGIEGSSHLQSSSSLSPKPVREQEKPLTSSHPGSPEQTRKEPQLPVVEAPVVVPSVVPKRIKRQKRLCEEDILSMCCGVRSHNDHIASSPMSPTSGIKEDVLPDVLLVMGTALGRLIFLDAESGRVQNDITADVGGDQFILKGQPIHAVALSANRERVLCGMDNQLAILRLGSTGDPCSSACPTVVAILEDFVTLTDLLGPSSRVQNLGFLVTGGERNEELVGPRIAPSAYCAYALVQQQGELVPSGNEEEGPLRLRTGTSSRLVVVVEKESGNDVDVKTPVVHTRTLELWPKKGVNLNSTAAPARQGEGITTTNAYATQAIVVSRTNGTSNSKVLALGYSDGSVGFLHDLEQNITTSKMQDQGSSLEVELVWKPDDNSSSEKSAPILALAVLNTGCSKSSHQSQPPAPPSPAGGSTQHTQEHFATVDGNDVVRVFRLAEHGLQLLWWFRNPHFSASRNTSSTPLLFSGCGCFLLCGTADGLFCWEVGSGKVVSAITKMKHPALLAVDWHLSTVVSCHETGLLRLWDGAAAQTSG